MLVGREGAAVRLRDIAFAFRKHRKQGIGTLLLLGIC